LFLFIALLGRPLISVENRLAKLVPIDAKLDLGGLTFGRARPFRRLLRPKKPEVSNCASRGQHRIEFKVARNIAIAHVLLG